MLQQASEDTALDQPVVCEWIKRFKGGQTSLKGSARYGRPSTSRNEENVNLIRDLLLLGTILKVTPMNR